MSEYQTFHAACLDLTAIAATPGDLIIAAREPMALMGFEPDHLGLLATGAPLFVDAATPSLRAAVRRHCLGLGGRSLFRVVLAERMGLSMATSKECHNAHRKIDAWIAGYTLVRLRPHPPGLTLTEDRLGWLNPPTGSSRAASDGQGRR